MSIEKNNCTPKLRFPGFTGEWTGKGAMDVCETIASPLKLQSSDYLSSGKYPIVDQSQSLICGWTNDGSGVIDNAPLIIFGDHTCALKYIDFPFVQGADGVKILSPLKDYNPRFVYQSFLSNPVEQDGYKRHFSDFREKLYMFPSSLDEQEKIAACLSDFDVLVSAQDQKVDTLKEQKKGLIQQLFPQLGESIPRLRFPEFKDEWHKHKFKSITVPAGKKNRQNLPLERYSISNELGFYPQSDQFEDGGGYLKDIDTRQYIIVPPKSFAYNPARINVGSIGYQNLGKEVIVSSLYEVFQTNEVCDDIFLWHWFHSGVFHRMVLDVQEGGVRQYFFYEKLKDCSISLPSIPEQKKIAECLSEIDNLIAFETSKLEYLIDHKAGLLQQLFPQSSK